MQAAVPISIYGFDGAGMTIPDKRQKLQERKDEDGNGTKLTPPPSQMRFLQEGEKPPRE